VKHGAPDDEVREQASLYSLGMLGEREAVEFEAHIESGCDVCSREVKAFQAVVRNIAYSPDEAEPPATVRQRLMELDMTQRPPVFSIRAEHGAWHEVMSGVLMKTLFHDEATGLRTSLVRMAAGSRLPAHRHHGVEQFYVLEGDCNVHGEQLGPGDFHVATRDTVHETTFTLNGTLFLLVAPEGCDVLDESVME
jgi:anti-sigma factor ChrR (cupin superfamily)